MSMDKEKPIKSLHIYEVSNNKCKKYNQLSAHNDVENALEWIPYDRIYNITYIIKAEKYRAIWIDGNISYWDNYSQNWTRGNQNMTVELKRLNNLNNVALEFTDEIKNLCGITQDPKTKDYMMVLNYKSKMYRAIWIDGNISYWDNYSQNWTRGNQNMTVELKRLNNLNNVALEFTDEIKNPCGITQDLKTKNYMMVLNYRCKKCNYICNTIHFQENFINWTSEWIPYDRFYNIIRITKAEKYVANWIDGNVGCWNNYDQNWIRKNQNSIVELKSLNNLNNVALEFMDEIKNPCGITQDPETKNYMMVLNYRCKKCNYVCNAIHFQGNFINWTSGNNEIDKFIQDNQLSVHNDVENALEWIPYDRFYNIICITKAKKYVANWIDGNVGCWNNHDHNWKRQNQNMIVELKSLNNLNDVRLQSRNKIKKLYGITQDPETKNYMMVLSNKCDECDRICNAIHFQRKFGAWTSGNNDVDKFIQYTQLSAHNNASDALEWIPFDRLYDIKYNVNDGFGKVYRAIWTGEGKYQNMLVVLKSLNNLKNIAIEFMNEAKKDHKVYGITQDSKTKNYMIVSNYRCKNCNEICNPIHFQQNFINWTSGNDDIDKLIQDTQLSVNDDDDINVLKWIPFDRFYDIKYIAKGGFGKVYKAIWTDGGEYQNMPVALKNLNNSKNITIEYMSEIILHSRFGKYDGSIIRFYGMTQDPETEDYMMVLKYADNGSLRNYLDKSYNEFNWYDKIKHSLEISRGLDCIHEKEYIHRDLHSGNILMFILNMCIADMGLCKPADYRESRGTKNNIYGVLPYIAPELLRGQIYTKSADIYSFGIIMYEIISGSPPYHDISHDSNLAIKICQGLRPRFNIKVPQLIVQLIKRCLDANPSNRPTAEETCGVLKKWLNSLNNNNKTELQKQIEEADKINNHLSNGSVLLTTKLGLSYKTHSEAIYTSRLLNFNNLPEPKNSDDYYEQNDNIISEKFSGSLQIDISQLNIN
ncbi:kinase-like domain-containing protein [Rhizophagus clarus]|uniref:Kinase-like domain-containing protein n=1 Tax=Rhizophagus clarus TaxID=94130 RepID=A0A8H3MDT3_9GLOM|nr:kinase-like domain-containing protein [Rhizophagus clarus]